MKTGMLFDIKELAVHDGPGIRTTVFLKGCPLRCTWCHNPESQSPEPQFMHRPLGDRLVGRRYSSEDLAELLNRQSEILQANDGGVTFSGGEPLCQVPFLIEVIDRLHGLHVTLDTSGYGEPKLFRKIVSKCNLVLFDLKIMDKALHKRFTGCGNEAILANLDQMNALETPLIIRVPLVPGVSDTDDNLHRIARTASRMKNLRRIDLLRYNRAAGGKYAGLGMAFKPGFDEKGEVNADPKPFQELGLEVRIR